MADGRVSSFLRQLGGGALSRDGGALTDGQLLECFLRDRDELAFEALVRRHGPMVLGVCRRVVSNTHDAEDAFQATFLALVHKAAAVVPRELVGHWLYGVAYRTALNARRLAARRGARELQVDKMPEREVTEPQPSPDLRPLLDRELSRLPEVYRVPVVLCDLGGKPRQEVARQLSVPEGTVSSRLARGRELLRKRLVRRGLMLTGVALVPALTEAASAAVPPPLLRATLEVGVLVATGRAAGAVSAPVACLLRMVLREMVVAKLKVAAVVLLAVALVGLAAGLAVRQAWPHDAPGDPLGDSPVAAAPAPPGEVQRRPAFVRVTDPGLEEGLTLREFVNVNGTLFFVTSNANGEGQLWKCAPTADGVKTTRLTNIPPSHRLGNSAPMRLTNVNGTLFFVSRDGNRGLELWKSDGTLEGTAPFKDINPGGVINPQRAPGAMPYLGLMSAGKTLFFVCSDGTRGGELWKSDGTAAGTALVKRVGAGVAFAGGGWRRGWADLNSTLFFMAADADHGTELWKSDGTEQGTVLVKDIAAGPYSANPCYLTVVNGILFLTADDGVHGRQLWRSDGTAAGTKMVKEINRGRAGGFPFATMGNLTAVGRTLFFAADDGVHGLELWKSDGTAEGTVMVKDINPGPASSVEWRRPGDTAPPGLSRVIPPGSTVQRHGLGTDTMAAVNGTLFFTADDGVHGLELWKSDGTAAGTVMVKDIAPGDKNADPSYLTNINGTLFFTAGDGAGHKKLWRSDGTEAGTAPVKDSPDGTKPSPDGGPVEHLTPVGGGLFFTVQRWGPDVPSQFRGSPDLWYMPAPRRPRD
jgi:RNA polymerase sigma factor (sigma-70 family)